LADAQHLPQGRSRAGDRHLNFHETRDNLEHVDDCPCRGVAGDGAEDY
jgi:hypothetical protein